MKAEKNRHRNLKKKRGLLGGKADVMLLSLENLKPKPEEWQEAVCGSCHSK